MKAPNSAAKASPSSSLNRGGTARSQTRHSIAIRPKGSGNISLSHVDHDHARELEKVKTTTGTCAVRAHWIGVTLATRAGPRGPSGEMPIETPSFSPRSTSRICAAPQCPLGIGTVP